MPLSSPALHRILRAAFWLAALSGLAIGAASARPAQQHPAAVHRDACPGMRHAASGWLCSWSVNSA